MTCSRCHRVVCVCPQPRPFSLNLDGPHAVALPQKTTRCDLCSAHVWPDGRHMDSGEFLCGWPQERAA